MRLSIKQIAQKAGVSVATISRAMNAETRSMVSEQTLRDVDKVVKKYGYTPNLAAKNLRKTPSKTIGVIFPYVENIFYSSYYTHILAGVSNHVLQAGYQFKMLLLKDEKEQWDNHDFRKGEGVNGLIITQWFRFFSQKQVLQKMDIPIIVINDYEEGIRAQFVCVDNVHGGYSAAEYLYSQGHRHMAVITGPSWSRDSRERLDGFQQFCYGRKHALAQGLIQQGDFDDETITVNALRMILDKHPQVTAIFCCNDNMAFMVIDYLKKMGIDCPKKISVIGFDDDFRAASYSPALTTIRMPVYEMAQEATRVLIRILEQKTFRKAPVNKIIFKTQLIERNTVIGI